MPPVPVEGDRWRWWSHEVMHTQGGEQAFITAVQRLSAFLRRTLFQGTLTQRSVCTTELPVNRFWRNLKWFCFNYVSAKQ